MERSLILGVNGVDATTGRFRDPPLSLGDLVRRIRREPLSPPGGHDHRRARRGLPDGVAAGDLRRTGWGVLFPQGAPTDDDEGLEALLAHRRQQAGERYREFRGADGYRPGETAVEFLVRHGAGPAGPVDPRVMPYYLLLVAGPEAIPYDVQHALDAVHAVGRLDLVGTADRHRYAEAVVAAESGALCRNRSLAFFAPENPDDPATGLSSQHLVAPLARHLHQSQRVRAHHRRFRMEHCPPQQATRAALRDRLREDPPPALLFTASHGVWFPTGDPRQQPFQGALLCGDWPGPERWQGPLSRDFYFAADDLDDEARIAGLVSFHFACHGLGTPRRDSFPDPGEKPRELALEPFVAALPRRLLARGALAVVGHVDRAWGFSFLWPGVGRQLAPFEHCLERLLAGQPVGHALEIFHRRAAELSHSLTSCLEREHRGEERCPDAVLADLWLAFRDATAYALCGDPAVRLAVKGRSWLRDPSRSENPAHWS